MLLKMRFNTFPLCHVMHSCIPHILLVIIMIQEQALDLIKCYPSLTKRSITLAPQASTSFSHRQPLSVAIALTAFKQYFTHYDDYYYYCRCTEGSLYTRPCCQFLANGRRSSVLHAHGASATISYLLHFICTLLLAVHTHKHSLLVTSGKSPCPSPTESRNAYIMQRTSSRWYALLRGKEFLVISFTHEHFS